MKPTTYFNFLYGLAVILGGIMAYRAENQLTSLFVEVLLGVGILINSYFMYKKNKYSFYIAILFAVTLTIFFAYNFAISNAFWPGALTAIGVFIIILTLVKIFRIAGPE